MRSRVSGPVSLGADYSMAAMHSTHTQSRHVDVRVRGGGVGPPGPRAPPRAGARPRPRRARARSGDVR